MVRFPCSPPSSAYNLSVLAIVHSGIHLNSGDSEFSRVYNVSAAILRMVQ